MELRTFEVHHVDNPDAAIGKLNKTDAEFEFDAAVLADYKLTLRKPNLTYSEAKGNVNRKTTPSQSLSSGSLPVSPRRRHPPSASPQPQPAEGHCPHAQARSGGPV